LPISIPLEKFTLPRRTVPLQLASRGNVTTYLIGSCVNHLPEAIAKEEIEYSMTVLLLPISGRILWPNRFFEERAPSDAIVMCVFADYHLSRVSQSTDLLVQATMMASAFSLSSNCFLIRNYDMAMTRKAISQWLPNEIIIKIVCTAPQVDQASLSRVSKLFHDISLPVLYRVVQLYSPQCITSFCTTILSNPATAGFVRSFTAGPDGVSAEASYAVICNSILHS
jgi:hypothetical protein